MDRMSKVDWGKLGVCVAAPLLLGALGAVFTRQSVGTWYRALERPAFTPPSWLFGPVWTALYLMMGVAAFLVWRRGWAARSVRVALALFVIQLALNGAWSPVFFGLRSPAGGLVVIAFLWVAIVLTLVRFRAVSALAAWLLVPYLLWTTFATVLNASICALN